MKFVWGASSPTRSKAVAGIFATVVKVLGLEASVTTPNSKVPAVVISLAAVLPHKEICKVLRSLVNSGSTNIFWDPLISKEF